MDAENHQLDATGTATLHRLRNAAGGEIWHQSVDDTHPAHPAWRDDL